MRRPSARRTWRCADRRAGSPRARCRRSRRTAAGAGRTGRRSGCPVSPRPPPPRRAGARTARARRSSSFVAGEVYRRAGHTEKSVRADVSHAAAATFVSLPGSRAASAAGFCAYGGGGGAVRPPALTGRPQQRPAHHQCRPGDQRRLRVLSAAHQVGRAGLQRAGGRTRGAEQRVLAGHLVGLPQRGVRVGHPGGPEQLPYVVVRELLQAPQHVGRPGRRGEGGEPLVEGEFVGTAGARGKSLSPRTWGSSGGSWERLGHARRLSGRPVSSAVPDDPQPDQGVAGVDPARRSTGPGSRVSSSGSGAARAG